MRQENIIFYAIFYNIINMFVTFCRSIICWCCNLNAAHWQRKNEKIITIKITKEKSEKNRRRNKVKKRKKIVHIKCNYFAMLNNVEQEHCLHSQLSHRVKSWRCRRCNPFFILFFFSSFTFFFWFCVSFSFGFFFSAYVLSCKIFVIYLFIYSQRKRRFFFISSDGL